MYAITTEGYRAINAGEDLQPGETLSDDVPESLIRRIEIRAARSRRDVILRASDWTQVMDNNLTVLARQAWAVYRQELRDLPSTVGFPDVPWPIAPVLDNGASNEPGETS